MIIFLFLVFTLLPLISADIVDRGSNWDTDNINGQLKKTFYASPKNIEYHGSFIPFEDYLAVSDDKGKIKFSTLNGDNCYIELIYEKKNVLSVAKVSIDIQQHRGGYYFTTDIGVDVNSMKYRLSGCDESFIDNKLNILDNINIDFNMAYDKQNISTNYNKISKELEFSIIDGKTGDLKFIDPKVTYNYSTQTNIWAIEGDTCSDSFTATNLFEPLSNCDDIIDVTSDGDLDSSDDSRMVTEVSSGLNDGDMFLIFWANISSLDVTKITEINWTYEGYTTDSGAKLEPDAYIWNVTASKWEVIEVGPLTGDDLFYSFNMFSEKGYNYSEAINSTGFTHFSLINTLETDSSEFIHTDYVTLTVTYSAVVSTILKSPSDSSVSDDLTNYFVSNQTSSDNIDLNTATLYIWNSDGSLNQTNLTDISGTFNLTNLSISLTSDGTYYWNYLINNTEGITDWADSNRTLIISTNAPTINLNSPVDYFNFSSGSNIYFNFTATDLNGLDTCKLWSNWTGTWHNNYTWISPNSGVQNYTTVSIGEDGVYKWNIWCNDSTNSPSFSAINFTFTIDTLYPNITINSVTNVTGSQTTEFSHNASDINLKSCKYSIYNSSDDIDGTNENVSFVCNILSKSITTADYGTFSLKTYAIDYAGNENSTNFTFSTTASSNGTIDGGGGGSTIIINQTIYWRMETEQEGDTYDLQMAVLATRSKEIKFYNNGAEEVVLNLTCEGNLCEYLTFSRDIITLPVGIDVEQITIVDISIPRDITNKTYLGNIIAIDEDGNSRVITFNVVIGPAGYLSLIFDKLISLKYFGEVGVPYAIFFFFALAFVAVISYYTILINVKGGKAWSGILGMFTGFILLIFI